MISVAMLIPGTLLHLECYTCMLFYQSYFSLRKSTSSLKSPEVYSLRISFKTLSEPLWTGMWRKEYTLGCDKMDAMACRDASM